MTDVRDREEITATRDPGEVVPPRRSLVTRALSPIRRAAKREVAVAQPKVVALLDTSLELEPKSRFPIVRWSLGLFVLLPSLAASIYLFAISSDQYVAETRFMVRQAEPLLGSGFDAGVAKKEESSSATPAPASPLGGMINVTSDDAEIVASYIKSRAVVDDVSRDVDVRAIFQRPEADFWARLPHDASAEDLSKYWKRMVSANIEATSGIVTVKVAAFRREDALVLAKAIIASSETLVNGLSAKVRTDMMQTAEGEVRRAEGQVRFALADLTTFRNSRHVIDPVLSAESNGKLLLELMTEKIESESEVFIAERVQGPSAPGMSSLRDKLTSINSHIEQLKDEMAGSKALSTNMAATLAQFETLELKKQFAETMYGFAANGVERARVASERQQVYLQVFDPPALPQDYTFPDRWADIVLISFAFLMMWICGATITASVIDHRL